MVAAALAFLGAIPVGGSDQEATPTGGPTPGPLGVLPACGLPFVSNFWTGRTLIFFGYHPDTQIRLLNESGALEWSGVLGAGDRQPLYLGDVAPRMTACASRPFTVLAGDSWQYPGNAGIGADDYVVDASGLAASTHFHSFTGGNFFPYAPQPFRSIVFAYENDTAVSLRNESGTWTWSGILNRGEFHVERDHYQYFMELSATKNVTFLQANDRGYFIPAGSGLFSGTHFYTWVEDSGLGLQMMAYYDDTRVTVTGLETGAGVWNGTLDEWEKAELEFDWAVWGDRAYLEITASKPITASSYEPWSGFANMDFASDATGTRLGKDFLTLARDGPNSPEILVFAYSRGARVEAWNATARTLVETHTLAPNEYVAIQTSNGVGRYARVRSDEPVSVLVGTPGASSAYAPVTNGSLPDLAARPGDITVDPSAPLFGTEVTLGTSIRNEGSGRAGVFAIRFYDGRPGTGAPIGTDAFSLLPLEPWGATQASVRWTPARGGTHEVCVVADPPDYVREADEGNNVVCRTIDIGEPAGRPDYVPSGAQPAGVARLGLGARVTLTVEVTNQGNGSGATPSVLELYNETTPTAPFDGTAIAPLAPGEVSPPFGASWIAPMSPGTYRIVAAVDHGDVIPEWDEGNNEHVWEVVVVPGPATTLAVGEPRFTSGATHVTSVTALELSVEDLGGVGILRTEYRIDGGSWTEYSGPFTLPTEGEHFLEWFSEDNHRNVEPVRSAVLRVDDTPPTVTYVVGDPRYPGEGLFVTSATPVSAAASDGGVTPVGLAAFELRVAESAWADYAGPFQVPGPDGPVRILVRARDHLGNSMEVAFDLILDNTPPTTVLSSVPPGTQAGVVSFQASDGGSGVARTEYRVEDGAWVTYSVPIRISEGSARVEYRSVDRLGNAESPRSLVVLGEPNLKPIVAAVFGGILVALGLYAASRRPWKGRRTGAGVGRAFAVTTVPFAAMELATGLVSFVTGMLSIPPLLGVGTAVDLAILVSGMIAAGLRFRPTVRPEPRGG